MLLLAFTALAVVLVPVFRGNFGGLARIRFRRTWLVVLALALQLLITLVWPGPQTWVHLAIHTASYAIAMAFLIENQAIPGFWLIGLGGVMNLAAIVANGGVMPATSHALATAGIPTDPGNFSNSLAMEAPRLAFLGDIFALPASWPLANVFSVGDLCVALGATIMVHRVSGSRLIPSGAGQFRVLLGYPSFLRLWGAQAVSHVGDWVYSFFVWAVLTDRVGGTQGGVRTLALLLVAQLAPSAIFGALLAGPMIDRLSRKGLMIAADVLRALAVATLFFTPEASVAHFYVVAVCLGLFGAVFSPALSASIPNLVAETHIVSANAMIGVTFHFAIALGPALGGMLIGHVAPQAFFAANALSFAVSAALVARAHVPRAKREDRTITTVWLDLVDGFRYVAGTPLVRGVIVTMSLVALGAATKAPLESLFVRRVLTAGSNLTRFGQVYGLITAAWGMGMLLGSIAAPAVARRWFRERLLAVSILIVGVAVVTVSRTQDFSTVLLAWLLAGAANAVGNVSYESLLQERTPDAVRGRVFAATDAALDGTYLGGAFVAAWLGSVLSIPGALAVSGSFLFAGALLAYVLLPTPGHAWARPSERATAQPDGPPTPAEELGAAT